MKGPAQILGFSPDVSATWKSKQTTPMRRVALLLVAAFWFFPTAARSQVVTTSEHAGDVLIDCATKDSKNDSSCKESCVVGSPVDQLSTLLDKGTTTDLQKFLDTVIAEISTHGPMWVKD